MISELIKVNRSYRRFEQKAVDTELLRNCIESARCSASAANRQRIRFVVVNDSETSARIFDCLRFAAFLKNWSGPAPSERPAAYIIMMTANTPDTVTAIDMGIAAQSILLTAMENGVGGCIFRSYDREKLDGILSRQGYSSEMVIALGYPSEKAVIVDPIDGDLKYYRDENDVHCVPKLSLDELII
ncbi:MAG: nitroreductase family protein [Clostridia bacterium]|nr:nitroreductase family protein [Clostridia bacterium]